MEKKNRILVKTNNMRSHSTKIISNGLFILLSLSIILFSYFKCIEKELLLPILGSFVTFYIGVLMQISDEDNLFKNLFEAFNNRYDNKLNDLFNELKINTTKILTEDEIKLIIDYFNLSSEEYLWYAKGRIPKDVWIAWKSGILENLQIPQVKEIYENETKTKRRELSYYGLVKELKKQI